MGIRLQDLASLVNGELTGDGELEITGAGTIRDAAAGQITFADGPRFVSLLSNCRASAAVIPAKIDFDGLPCIRVRDVHQAFATIVSQFRPHHARFATTTHPTAIIAPTAKIGAQATIHPYVHIDDDVEIGDRCVIHTGARVMAGCRIGSDVTLYPNVVLYENTVLGDRCTVHANAVIGAYGFGYKFVDGQHRLSAQLGNVVIGNDVDIGACSTIDRGTYDSTTIGEGTKIDNQVMVAHNCHIGKHNLLCSQVGIAGSCMVGDYVVMGGQVGVRDHMTIGDRAMLGAKAGVMRDIPANTPCLGVPAKPEREQLQIMVLIDKLPEMRRQIRALQQQVSALNQAADLQSKKGAA